MVSFLVAVLVLSAVVPAAAGADFGAASGRLGPAGSQSLKPAYDNSSGIELKEPGVSTMPTNVETYREIAAALARQFPERREEVLQAANDPSATAQDLEDLISEISRDKSRGPAAPDGGGQVFSYAPRFGGTSGLQTEGSDSWANDILFDDFGWKDHIREYITATDPAGTYTISANGNLAVVSKDSTGGGTGAAHALTDDLGLDPIAHVLNEPAYTVETVFIPKSPSNRWFRVILDDRIGLILGSDIAAGDNKLNYYSNGQLTFLKDLNVGVRYRITASFGLGGATTYSVTLYDYSTLQTTSWTSIPRATAVGGLDYFVFGETNIAKDFGWGEWEYFRVTGMSTARWFETFKDGNAADWRPWAQDTATFDVYNRMLELSSDAASFDNAYTPYFDYNTNSGANGYWTVSFDFRLDAADSHWFIVLANDQFLLFMEGLQLRYYCLQCAATENPVANLVQGSSYYIKLVQKTANTYDIHVDNPLAPTQTAKFVNFQATGAAAFRLGDFSAADHGAGAWSNFRVISGMGPDSNNNNNRDDDIDGLSDSFEHSARQILWADDFEGVDYSMGAQSTDSAAFRWEFSNDFAWGYASGGNPGNAYAGTYFYVGTKIGGAWYSNSMVSTVTSPRIAFTNVANDVEPVVVYNVWWHFADGVDNCEVRAKWTPAAGPPAQDIQLGHYDEWGPWTPPLGPSQWAHQEKPLPINPATGVIGATDFQVYATMMSDNNAGSQLDGGCFVDEVSILAGGLKDVGDGDGDTLGGFVEWQWAHTSPFVDDTDGDALTDFEEMKIPYLSDAVINSNGRADPLVVDFFYEVDRQRDGAGALLTISAATQTTMISDMWAKGMRLHFWFDDDILNSVDWWDTGGTRCAGSQDPGQLETTYHDSATDGRTWQVLVMKAECNGAQTLGIAAKPGNMLLLNAELLNSLPGACTTTSAQQWVKTFHHEHGHNLNLDHYDQTVGGASTWMVRWCQPTGGVFTEFSVAEWRGISTAGLG